MEVVQAPKRRNHLHTRPQSVTIAVVFLALLSLLNFTPPLITAPFLRSDYPTIVLVLGIALGVLGLLAAGGYGC